MANDFTSRWTFHDGETPPRTWVNSNGRVFAVDNLHPDHAQNILNKARRLGLIADENDGLAADLRDVIASQEEDVEPHVIVTNRQRETPSTNEPHVIVDEFHQQSGSAVSEAFKNTLAKGRAAAYYPGLRDRLLDPMKPQTIRDFGFSEGPEYTYPDKNGQPRAIRTMHPYRARQALDRAKRTGFLLPEGTQEALERKASEPVFDGPTVTVTIPVPDVDTMNDLEDGDFSCLAGVWGSDVRKAVAHATNASLQDGVYRLDDGAVAIREGQRWVVAGRDGSASHEAVRYLNPTFLTALPDADA